MQNKTTNKDFSARLNQILDDAEFPAKGSGRQTKLAEMYGVSQKGARKWLEGEAIPRLETVRRICADFDVGVEWLLSGVTAGISEPQSEYEAHARKGDQAYMESPIGIAIRGQWIRAGRHERNKNLIVRQQGLGYRVPRPPNFISDGGDFAWMHVPDDSMAPALTPNEMVLIDLAMTTVRDGAIHSLDYGARAVLRRVFRRIDGSIMVSPDNSAYPSETLTEQAFNQSVTIIGVAVARFSAL